MARHFRCTACGKCCVGWLPLTLKDALANIGRFPLAVVWTPIRQGTKDFGMTEQLGFSFRTAERKNGALRIIPTAYIPPKMACPALTPDNLCAIHAEKPLRCRTMPFFPYRDEENQTDLLIPRPGWECDTSLTAPSVYKDKSIIDRSDFDMERVELQSQVPILRSYAQRLLDMTPSLAGSLTKALSKQGGGHVAVSFASLLRQLQGVDRAALATAQLKRLGQSIDEMKNQSKWSDYKKNYEDWAWEMERLT